MSRMSAGHTAMVVAALIAVVANYTALRALDDTTRVAVAAAEIQAGQTVTSADLGFVDIRVDGDLLLTLLSPERLPAVEGWVATSALAPGELLRGSDLQAPSAPSAQRAMSIPIEPEHAVAGDLRAGDRIDLIEVDGRSATYLVTAAEVLAVPPAEAAQGIAGGLRSFSVTIAVDDAAALEIAVAIRGGQLEVVRSTGSAAATAERLDGGTDEAGAGRPGGPEDGGA